jgi:Flp pilus assembly protein TadG
VDRPFARQPDAGTMSLELVLLTPLLVAFMMLMVGLGLVVEGQSQVDGAARDAARAASIGRTTADADADARDAANATLSDRKQRCRGGGPDTVVDFSQWRPGGQVTVTVRCHIDLSGLSLIGIAPSKTMTGTATAPIDTLRRIG